jgi:hypothetical protein
MQDRDRAGEIADQKQRSFDWMKDNYYGEWEQVFKAYKCVRDTPTDPDGKPDKEAVNIALPLTWAHIRRSTARATAQVPNLKYKSKDPQVGELIGRTLMYQWDTSGVQRQQKKHFTQAQMFGISIRPWYWAIEEHTRNKRVNPMDPKLDMNAVMRMAEMYEVPLEYLTGPEGPQQAHMVVRGNLLKKYGRGGLLPLKYDYVGYEGPKCDFLFIGDCFFQPDFQCLQTSDYFIVQRRRNLAWMKRVAKRFPAFAPGFEQLVSEHPQGSRRLNSSRDTESLRERMAAAIGHSEYSMDTGEDHTKEWTILERHKPGDDPKLAFAGEESVWIGEIPYPYDLDGKIAFTELVLVDDLLCGVGDSTPRVIRGLQELYDLQSNTRMGLVNNLMRPLVGTSNRELWENPDLIKRWSGLRLVPMRGPGDMWIQGEQAAMAAAAAGLQEDSALMRQYQLATGESNMSMSANVDPQQNRTATGARIAAYNQDVLTKDMVDMYNESIRADAEMMFLLNRSELSDAVEFDAAKYNRTYTAEQDLLKEQWAKAEPIHFQMDGEITAEVGSTLADDDEGRVSKATNLFQAAMTRPDLFNQQKARDEFLIAMGKGRELQQWAAPQQPPPPPEVNASLSVSAQWELLSAEERQQLLIRAGVLINAAPAQAMPAGPDGAPAAGPDGVPVAPPSMPPGAQAAQAAQGTLPSPEPMAVQ